MLAIMNAYTPISLLLILEKVQKITCDILHLENLIKVARKIFVRYKAYG